MLYTDNGIHNQCGPHKPGYRDTENTDTSNKHFKPTDTGTHKHWDIQTLGYSF